MVESTIKVDGAREFLKNLRKLDKELPKGLREIHKKVAEPTAAKAARKVNSKSGRLAGSIRPTATQRGAGISAGARLKYGAVNHFGWPGHNITGNPFLYDAVEEDEARIWNDYETLLGRWIDSVWIEHFG